LDNKGLSFFGGGGGNRRGL